MALNHHELPVFLRTGAVDTSLALRTEGGSERGSCPDAGGDGWLTTGLNWVLGSGLLLRSEVDLSWEDNRMKV